MTGRAPNTSSTRSAAKSAKKACISWSTAPGEPTRRCLGPNAEKNEPVFWQIAGINGQVPSDQLDRTLFELQIQLERELEVHFPSFSAHSVVYKVQGTIEILRRYYPELRDPDYASAITMGHARYSTNTNPIFERAQPFNLIGHNGEFNTISRFRLESEMLDIPMVDAGSDSQDVDRTIYALCMRYGMDLIEAMEHIFPPFEHDLIQTAPDIHAMYTEMRQSFGPFAQGPAAVVARLGNEAVFSVDALGLRPLWYGETEKEYFITSERGVYALDSMSVSPRPMAPGEKIAMTVNTGQPIKVLEYPAIQQYVYNRYRDRQPAASANGGHLASRDGIRRCRSRARLPDAAERQRRPRVTSAGGARGSDGAQPGAKEDGDAPALGGRANQGQCRCHVGLRLGTLSRGDRFRAGAKRERADWVAGLGWPAGRVEQYAREPGGLLQRDDCGGDQPVDRP